LLATFLEHIFPIVDMCLHCEDIARQIGRWYPDGELLAIVLRRAFPGSHMQHIADLHSNAHDTRSRNRRQKPAPENCRRFLASVFHASCKISGARNQHGRIKSNQTFYLAIRPTDVK